MAASEHQRLEIFWKINLDQTILTLFLSVHLNQLNFPQLNQPNAHIAYRDADKSLARPTSRCILFDDENISFDASLVIYIYI
jgi:hypothetical protein